MCNAFALCACVLSVILTEERSLHFQLRQDTIPNITKTSSYAHNLDGSLNTLTYPSGHSVYSAVGGAGLPLTTVDSAVVDYVSSGMYTAWGAHSYSSLGLKMSESILYNQRLQPCWTYAPQNLTATSCTASYVTGTYIDLKYNFNLGADNGNLGGITNDRNSNRSQSYVYDAVNRITSAATLPACTATCWNLAFTLDQWANLTAVAGTGTATLTPNANNQISVAPFTYDASGNELTDVTNTYTWNAESEMETGGGVTYLYDGRGNRVKKSGAKLYWYGPSGEVLDETDTTGSTTNAAFSEYIYFAGARIARRDYLNNVYYYFEDQVHSSRVIAEIPAGTTTPTLCYDADFYPYGGEIDFTDTCAQNYKFQGKERDPETGNDYFGARFYSSTYGRFLSPDWSSVPAPVPYANLTNPQTLNQYAFVNDNPESFADLNGHDPGVCNSGGAAGDRNCPTPPQSSPAYTNYQGHSAVEVSDSSLTPSSDGNGGTTYTHTTTTVYYNNDVDHEGQYLGATQSTTTWTVKADGTMSNYQDTEKSIDLKSAIAVVGNDSVALAQSMAATASVEPYFYRAVAADAKAHPIDYTLKAAALISPFIEVPAAYEGVKAGVELAHAALDAGRAAYEVKQIRQGQTAP
jgi:RHS repeat-associated protein